MILKGLYKKYVRQQLHVIWQIFHKFSSSSSIRHASQMQRD